MFFENNEKEKKKEIENINPDYDWRAAVLKLDNQVKEALSVISNEEKREDLDDYVNIKAKYRRFKIEDQCRKLNKTVNLPSRTSWRDKIYGNADQKPTEQTESSTKKTSPHVRRKISWQRRTKIYYVDRSVDIQGINIIDNIHIKRSQIEAKLLEYNQPIEQDANSRAKLMLTYPGYEKPFILEALKETKEEEATIQITDIDLKSLSLKNNTLRKKSIFKELTRKSSFEKVKKVEPPSTRNKNYSASMDWREELKNRKKAKEQEAMASYTLGMPDYKEPESKVEEAKDDNTNQDTKWEKTEEKWEKVKLKPPRQAGSKNEEENKRVDPFKISLRPVADKNNTRLDGKSCASKEQVMCMGESERDKIECKKLSHKMKSLKSLSDDVSVNEIKDSLFKGKERKSDKKDISMDKKLEGKETKNKILSEEIDNNKGKTSKFEKERNTKNIYPYENVAKKYVTKIINFVAIKVAVDDMPVPTKRRRSIIKKRDEKPPRPVERAPSLPKDVLLEHAYDFISEIKEEKAHTLENTLSLHEIEIGTHAEEIKEKALVMESPIIKEKKVRDENFYKPRRRKMPDYVPEPLPKRMTRRDSDVEPIKFSSAADNCVTKSLFVGSQYVGPGGKQNI